MRVYSISKSVHITKSPRAGRPSCRQVSGGLLHAAQRAHAANAPFRKFSRQGPRLIDRRCQTYGGDLAAHAVGGLKASVKPPTPLT